MAGLLGDIYSASNTLKRKVNGLLSDPMGTVNQFVGQLGDDTNTNINNMLVGHGLFGNKSVLTTPQQAQAARAALADYGAQSGMAAATVWHGSPHKFDKFDAGKIGTGEGAQAYGHGLYLAENPEVARSYAGANNVHPASIAKLKEIVSSPDFRAPSDVKWASDELARLESIGSNHYKVDLPDEQIAKMLDWDKPLSQQHLDVQKAFGKVVNKDLSVDTGWGKLSGSEALKAAIEIGGAIKKGSGEELLRQAGIPGIRYLDVGSRGAGAGSSNFVVFPGNESLLNIMERNGKPVNSMRGLLGK